MEAVKSEPVLAMTCGGTYDGWRVYTRQPVIKTIQSNATDTEFWEGIYHRTDERIDGCVVYTLDPNTRAGDPNPVFRTMKPSLV